MIRNGSNRSPWKTISKEYPIFLGFVTLKMGNGNAIRFWGINGGVMFCFVRNSLTCVDMSF